jgi:hypothetical protein
LIAREVGIAPMRRTLWHPSYTAQLLQSSLAWILVLLGLEAYRAGARNAVRSASERYGRPSILVGVPLAALLFAHTALIHDTWKAMLGVVTPYTWDVRLADADEWVHRVAPWRLTHAVLGAPAATSFIDWVYWLWYPFLWAAFAWTAWTHRRRLRTRVLVTWALTWVLLGTVVAHFFASGGPVFMEALTGDARFAALTVRLGEIHGLRPLHALPLQQGVWANVEAGGGAFWISMSAMPSLHVGAPVVFALAAWHVFRPLAVLLWLFVLLTLVGSVHLGWHYALDGEVAILAVIVIWWAVGRFVTGKAPPDP